MLSAKQGSIWYHFYHVFGMTRSGIEPTTSRSRGDTLPLPLLNDIESEYHNARRRRSTLHHDYRQQHTELTERYVYICEQSPVRYQGLLSEQFPVLQGTRQGGKSSLLVYLFYIDNLIRELCMIENGLFVYRINFSCPTVADDMFVMAYSKVGLDNMSKICKSYTEKWKFVYNENKCGVIEYNENCGYNKVIKSTILFWK